MKPSPGITPSAGITPVGINTRMNSIEALRGLSYVRVALDESFAKREGLDVSQLVVANAETLLGEAGIRIPKTDPSSPGDDLIPTLLLGLTVIKDKDNEADFVLSARLIEAVAPRRDLSRTIEAATWHTETNVTLRGTTALNSILFIAGGVEMTIDRFIRDYRAANRK
ncbi:MAG TPA: hypothetical protein VGV87_15355 [Blastocatellia bacterium]|nr:hypothetical protein [Blastocatellia bacterium]